MNLIIKRIIATVFILFALVQYNDPDWYIWIPIYFMVSLFYLFSFKIKWIYYLTIAALLFWSLYYVNDFVKWIKDGTPSITGSMKAENPEIELMREFFGILLCLSAILFRWYKDVYKNSNSIES
ncbi:MAG: hypothetical protein RLZZ546_662 [Bacteroidota bacterium]|jgi:hypothetical protein